MSIITELKKAAGAETDVDKHVELNNTADQIEAYIKSFYFAPTADNLQLVNGLWAYGTRLLSEVTPPGNDEDKKAVA